VSLTHYVGGGGQARHSHDFAQFSFLLAGRMAETLEGRDFSLDAPSAGFKPAGSIHSNRWGKEGALVFSVTLAEPAASAAEGLAPGWRNLGPGVRLGAMVEACFQPDEPLRRLAVDDVLAIVREAPESCGPAPTWLRAARERLGAEGELRVQDVARAVGVDRSHLTRAFRQCYGIPPSVYRRRILAARAVAGVARTEASLASVAHEAGFSDHAHMSRTLRGDTGLMPIRLRSLLTDEITSIQDYFRPAR
jgi:AraC-like DNA-binding protein